MYITLKLKHVSFGRFPDQESIISANQWSYIVHSENWVILGTPACRALGVIDDRLPLSALVERARTSSLTVRTIQVDSVSPSPGCSLHDQYFSE